MWMFCKIYVREIKSSKNAEVYNFLLYNQGVRLAVPHLPVAIGNFAGLLEGISMVARWASGNKIDTIMVVREFIILCAIKHHSNSPTIGNLIWKIR